MKNMWGILRTTKDGYKYMVPSICSSRADARNIISQEKELDKALQISGSSYKPVKIVVDKKS